MKPFLLFSFLPLYLTMWDCLDSQLKRKLTVACRSECKWSYLFDVYLFIYSTCTWRKDSRHDLLWRVTGVRCWLEFTFENSYIYFWTNASHLKKKESEALKMRIIHFMEEIDLLSEEIGLFLSSFGFFMQNSNNSTNKSLQNFFDLRSHLPFILLCL